MAIPDHFTIQFGKNFEQSVQQLTSRFQKAAIIDTSCSGEAVTFNYDLPVDDNETTGERLARTNLQEIGTFKRWLRPRKFDLATYDIPFDEVLLAPTIMGGGRHINAHSAAYGRRMDKVFIDGLLGTNYTGTEGVTPAEIPTANNVAVDWNAPGMTDANSGLIVDKIIEAIGILADNESYGDDAEARGISLWGALTPRMERSLLYAANASSGSTANRLFSKDFMPPVLDEKGRIKFFLGVNWIRSGNLPVDPADSTVQFASVWTSDAVKLGVWKAKETRVSERADLKYATQFFSEYSFNACRTEDKKVVKIATKNNL